MLSRIDWTKQIVCRTIMYMSTHTSHDRTEKRQFTGEREADAILACLNLEFSDQKYREYAPAVRRRVFLVLQRIKKAQQQIREKQLSGPELSAEFAAINRVLWSYPVYHSFVPDETRAIGWKVDTGYRAAYQSGLTAARLSGKPTVEGRLMTAAESIAVHGIVGLAHAGLLDRLRTCKCGLWYFARFSHQNFCSTTCRVKFWEGSELRKEQKRQRARENYLYKKAHPPSARKGKR
jgi:hypothetical protein